MVAAIVDLNDRASTAAIYTPREATTHDRRPLHVLVSLCRSRSLVNEAAIAAVGGKFPDLNACRHKVGEPLDIVRSKQLQASSVVKGNQNLPIMGWGDHEVEHRLVPHGQLGTGCVAAPRPRTQQAQAVCRIPGRICGAAEVKRPRPRTDGRAISAGPRPRQRPAAAAPDVTSRVPCPLLGLSPIEPKPMAAV